MQVLTRDVSSVNRIGNPHAAIVIVVFEEVCALGLVPQLVGCYEHKQGVSGESLHGGGGGCFARVIGKLRLANPKYTASKPKPKPNLLQKRRLDLTLNQIPIN